MVDGVLKFDFHKTKYGDELLIDLITLETIRKVIPTPHYVTYYDITLFTGGKGTFYIDQYKFNIKEGTVLLTSPGQIRKFDIKIPPEGYVLIFEEEFLSCFLNDFKFISDLKYFNNHLSPPLIILKTKDTEYFVKLMQNIDKEIKTFKSNDQQILRALLYQSLVWLNRKYSTEYPQDGADDFNRYIRHFIKLVNSKFRTQHSVTYYAEELCISTGHLNDLCKTHLEVNAKHYIQNRIILEAKRLLLYSDLQVSEIAIQLGFGDTSYFVRMFKQFTGITPLSFREKKLP